MKLKKLFGQPNTWIRIRKDTSRTRPTTCIVIEKKNLHFDIYRDCINRGYLLSRQQKKNSKDKTRRKLDERIHGLRLLFHNVTVYIVNNTWRPEGLFSVLLRMVI